MRLIIILITNKLTMKKTYLLILMSFITLSSIAQVEGNGFGPGYKWTIGLGVNTIDSDGTGFNQAFKTKQWNFKHPIMFTAERKWNNTFATSFSLSFNQLEKSNLLDGVYPTKDFSYVAFDLNGHLYFDHFIFKTTRNDWFEAYAIAGLGIPVIINNDNNNADGSFNTGLGLNFWISDNWGIRLQSVGKFAFNHGTNNHSNHIQNSFAIIARF